MLHEFQNEIIATIAILTLIIIYLLSKRKTASKPQKKPDEDLQATKTKEEIKEIQKVEPELATKEINKNDIDKKHDTDYEELTGTQEGDFGELVECQDKEECVVKRKKSIHKRDPIKHEKITKQKFSEFSGIRILIAEDNLINQKVLTGLLAGSGIDIVLANDGKETLDILKNDDNFLLILMDAHMPRIDGFEATRTIRKNRDYDHIAIVALSGDTASDDITKMTEAGMDEHLEKPLRMDALYDIFYSYTGSQELEEYIEVVMTQELNGDKGLEVCGGDDCFYREILNEFITDYQDSAQTLDNLLQEHKLKEADKLLLDILGITANIGATKLNIIAHDIKVALSDTDEKSYLTLVEQYKTSLDSLLEDIKEYI